MIMLLHILIILCSLQSSKAASADGENCTTSSTCALGSTCYLRLCTPGVNDLPCNSSQDCFGNANCEPSSVGRQDFCLRPAPCTTSEDCISHESCDVDKGLCVGGIHGTPCSSNEQCLPSHECRNSICHQPRQVGGVSPDDLSLCVVGNMQSVPEPDIIELPSWLLGAVALIVSSIAAQAQGWTLKPESLRRRRIIFYMFLAGSVLLWVAYFVLAVIHQVSFHREVSNLEEQIEAISECFTPDSVLYDQFRQNKGETLKQFRIRAIGFFFEVLAIIVLTLAIMRLVWRYLEADWNKKPKVQKKMVISIGLAVAAVGLIGIFVGAKIASQKVNLSNPFCEIVTANDKEFVTCALSKSDIQIVDVSFSDNVEEVCSAMTQQTIETGSVPANSSEFVSLAELFTSSENVTQVTSYWIMSATYALPFFLFSGFGSPGVMRARVAFTFLKVIFDLLLAICFFKLEYRVGKVNRLLIGAIAILLVICELGTQISVSVWAAGFFLKVRMLNVALICGDKMVPNDVGIVFDRSYSPEVGDVLQAFSTFIFAVIGIRQLFTS